MLAIENHRWACSPKLWPEHSETGQSRPMNRRPSLQPVDIGPGAPTRLVVGDHEPYCTLAMSASGPVKMGALAGNGRRVIGVGESAHGRRCTGAGLERRARSRSDPPESDMQRGGRSARSALAERVLSLGGRSGYIGSPILGGFVMVGVCCCLASLEILIGAWLTFREASAVGQQRSRRLLDHRSRPRLVRGDSSSG